MNGSTEQALALTQNATLAPDVILKQGAGKAYQSVAQSMAIAVQDATDSMRNTTTMASTAMGIALAQFLATKDATYLTAIESSQGMITSAAATLTTIGTSAGAILKGFPSGS